MAEKRIIGVDVGGTFMKFGLFKEDGTLLEKWQSPTDQTKPDVILQQIRQEVQKAMQTCGMSIEDTIGIGIGVPGSVDRQGIVISAPNLGWSMVNIQELAKDFFSVPVGIANDANAAALGEQFFGSGEGCDSMVFVTLGTGVGGGVVVNGRLINGAFGGAGEIGHMLMNEQETRVCTCGKCGCLEQYASARGIAKMAEKMLVSTNQKTLLRSYDVLTAKEVFDAIKAKDSFAMEIGEMFGSMLGRALSYVAAAVDPQMFVIGGGMSAAGEILLDYVEKYYRRYAFDPSKKTPFRLARLGNDAGIFGAARMIQMT